VLVGGVNSPVRAYRHIGGDPVILVRSQGAQVVDADGKRYVDLIMGWGALLLGHCPAPVVAAIRKRMRETIVLGLTHPDEARLAQLICEAVPSVERVRFTTSGTEACMTAVRLARAHTGRAKILTIEGGYHGHGESVIARTGQGVAPGAIEAKLTVPFNDLEAMERAIAGSAHELACVILEPVPANMGVILPRPGYLKRIRALTARHGILLILDEVVTGFRLALGGAQERFGVAADLTTFGKIIGGGLPIGAVGGRAAIMTHLAPEGEVFHGGTFAGHPLVMAAGIATLTQLKATAPYGALERLTQRLARGLSESAQRAGVPIQVNQIGSMFTVFFSDGPVEQAAAVRASGREPFARWVRALQQRGVLMPPSPYEAAFVSTAHTGAQIARCVLAARQAFGVR
jgi:glutamate-1-semialdehyde 2,1-aminomutase